VYAGANPVNLVDPSGYAPELPYYQQLALNTSTGCAYGVLGALVPAAVAASTGVGVPIGAGAIITGCGSGIVGGVIATQAGPEAGAFYDIISFFNKLR
jgi:hypothetical protein